MTTRMWFFCCRIRRYNHRRFGPQWALHRWRLPSCKPWESIPRPSTRFVRREHQSFQRFSSRRDTASKPPGSRVNGEGTPLAGVPFFFDCSSRASFRSEEHTSELQSLRHLVCRLLLEKKQCKEMLIRLCRTLDVLGPFAVNRQTT